MLVGPPGLGDYVSFQLVVPSIKRTIVNWRRESSDVLHLLKVGEGPHSWQRDGQDPGLAVGVVGVVAGGGVHDLVGPVGEQYRHLAFGRDHRLWWLLGVERGVGKYPIDIYGRSGPVEDVAVEGLV